MRPAASPRGAVAFDALNTDVILSGVSRSGTKSKARRLIENPYAPHEPLGE